MYEKEINLIDVSFIFLRKLASRECILRGPKMLKIDFGGGLRAVPCPWQYGPGFLDFGAFGPLVKNSKMITGKPVIMRSSGSTDQTHDISVFTDITLYVLPPPSHDAHQWPVSAVDRLIL